MSITIPVLSRTPNLLKELIRALPNVTFHEVTNPDNDLHFKNSDILISDFDLLGKYLYDLPHTKWVQGTWAGVDKLLPFVEQSKTVPYQITRFSGKHFGSIMGEYVVANIVNYERNFFQINACQQNSQWYRKGKITKYRTIFDLTIGVLGVGEIGQRIGQVLHFMGAKIIAFGRRPTLSQEDYPYVTKYHTKDTLPSLLQTCDYVINVLPKTTETDCLLDNDILKNCAERQSVLINIGRSNIISESSIIKALHNKWLSAVILDVFDEEPLPENNPLWQTEQVFITPHVAGMSRAKDIAEQFASNFYLYQKKLPLPAIIDFTKGY